MKDLVVDDTILPGSDEELDIYISELSMAQGPFEVRDGLVFDFTEEWLLPVAPNAKTKQVKLPRRLFL